MRGIVTPPTAIGRPVLRRRARVWSGVSVGYCWRRTAQAPVTAGVAIEVPDIRWYPLPGTDDRMLSPGAKRERYGAVLL